MNLEKEDPEVYSIIHNEYTRQRDGLELVNNAIIIKLMKYT